MILYFPHQYVLVVVVELANARCDITNFPALKPVGILTLQNSSKDILNVTKDSKSGLC